MIKDSSSEEVTFELKVDHNSEKEPVIERVEGKECQLARELYGIDLSITGQAIFIY